MEARSRLDEPLRGLLEALLAALNAKFGDRLISVVLFGSAARGAAAPGSDIDLLLVVKGLPASRLERQRLFMEAEAMLEPLLAELRRGGKPFEFSPLLKTPEEASRLTPLYLDLTEDAVLLKDEGGFFQSILQRLRERLRELGATRVWRGKKWYWLLKQDYKFGERITLE